MGSTEHLAIAHSKSPILSVYGSVLVVESWRVLLGRVRNCVSARVETVSSLCTYTKKRSIIKACHPFNRKSPLFYLPLQSFSTAVLFKPDVTSMVSLNRKLKFSKLFVVYKVWCLLVNRHSVTTSALNFLVMIFRYWSKLLHVKQENLYRPKNEQIPTNLIN